MGGGRKDAWSACHRLPLFNEPGNKMIVESTCREHRKGRAASKQRARGRRLGVGDRFLFAAALLHSFDAEDQEVPV